MENSEAVGGDGLHGSHHHGPPPAPACRTAGALPEQRNIIKTRKVCRGDSGFLSFREQDELLAGGNPMSYLTLLWPISSERGWDEMPHVRISCSPRAPHLVFAWSAGGGRPLFGLCCAIYLTIYRRQLWEGEDGLRVRTHLASYCQSVDASSSSGPGADNVARRNANPPVGEPSSMILTS